MTVLFLDNSSDPAETSGPPQDANILAPTLVLVPVGDIRVGQHPVTFDVQEDAAGDATARAALFGRYLGQITARISRAWLRPRTSIGGDRFSCWVQVEQDSRGNVEEITLKSCNGTIAWQASLVHAIESASPLPAPPDSSVFTKTLTFEMGADGFDRQRSADGYEPALASTRDR